MSDTITYMGYQWISVVDGVVTVGINEEAASDLGENLVIHLPEQDDVLIAGKICGELETDGGSLNLYCPVAGTVIEINDAVIENSDLLLEDPMDEGWLFKIEADDPDKIDLVSLRNSAEDDDDEDEEDEDLDEEDEEDGEEREEDRD